MRAVVIYESLFGNTRVIAEAVADGLRVARQDVAVECRRVDESGDLPHDVDLVVLGAPTHFWGLTKSVTRTMEGQYERRWMRAPSVNGDGETRQAATTTGMRTWLASLPSGRGRAAAAFDTCMTGPRTGGARAGMARQLRRAGYHLVAEPQSFLVAAVAGPLRPGETERARAWGGTLARALDERNVTIRRTAMERQNALFDGQDGLFGSAPGGPAPTSPTSTPRESTAAVIRERRDADITRIVTTAGRSVASRIDCGDRPHPSHRLSGAAVSSEARPASRRATGTRNGEHET